MSSVIFQPLLHDSIGWKPTNSTYSEHFQWKKKRLTRKDSITSAYSQEHQRQLQRQKEFKRANGGSPVAKHEEPIIQRVVSVKKNNQRQQSSKSCRVPSSKAPPVVLEEPPALAVQQKQRPLSTNRETANGLRASQRSSNAVVPAIEQTPRPASTFEQHSVSTFEQRPASTFEQHRSQREETGKVFIDANNDNSRHWLNYPNPTTPQYIIDGKVRLGQMKAPAILARAKSALYASTEQTQKIPQLIERTESASITSQQHKQKSNEQRHFLDFNLPDTPDELRAARHRVEKHRYNPSLDNYPSRPQTCPLRTHEINKAGTSVIATDSQIETLPNVQSTSLVDALANDNEENKTADNESPSIMIKLLDVDGLPSEYVEALETANAAQEEYFEYMKQHAGKKSEQFVYRLPAMPSGSKNDSFKANRPHQQPHSTPMNNPVRQQEFGDWVRQASDQERTTAMKILHDVLNHPVINDDCQLTQQIPLAPRTKSATRKLGRVRTQPRFPSEQNEQQFVQHDLWNLTRSDGLITTHPIHGSKLSVVQI